MILPWLQRWQRLHSSRSPDSAAGATAPGIPCSDASLSQGSPASARRVPVITPRRAGAALPVLPAQAQTVVLVSNIGQVADFTARIIAVRGRSVNNNNTATGKPTIRGMALVGQTLTASTTGIMDDDGLTGVSYSYQWIRVDGSNEDDISGATSRTYRLVDAEEGKKIKVEVSFTDEVGYDEIRKSDAYPSSGVRP